MGLGVCVFPGVALPVSFSSSLFTQRGVSSVVIFPSCDRSASGAACLEVVAGEEKSAIATTDNEAMAIVAMRPLGCRVTSQYRRKRAPDEERGLGGIRAVSSEQCYCSSEQKLKSWL